LFEKKYSVPMPLRLCFWCFHWRKNCNSRGKAAFWTLS